MSRIAHRARDLANVAKIGLDDRHAVHGTAIGSHPVGGNHVMVVRQQVLDHRPALSSVAASDHDALAARRTGVHSLSCRLNRIAADLDRMVLRP